MGFWDGSGISLNICKESAPLCRQITPHQSVFAAWCSSWLPSQQFQSTEGTYRAMQEKVEHIYFARIVVQSYFFLSIHVDLLCCFNLLRKLPEHLFVVFMSPIFCQLTVQTKRFLLNTPWRNNITKNISDHENCKVIAKNISFLWRFTDVGVF